LIVFILISGVLAYPIIPSGVAPVDLGFGDPRKPDFHIQIMALSLSISLGLAGSDEFFKYRKPVCNIYILFK